MTSHDHKDNARSIWAVVLMYGRENDTAACLESLLRQDHPNLTILLVDNASPDGAGTRLQRRFPGIRYLHTGTNLGYAAGNNRGSEHALSGGAEYVLIVNNDTVLDTRCVSLLADALDRRADAAAVAPKILYYDASQRIAFAGGDFSIVRGLGLHRRANEQDDPDEPARLDEITFVTGSCFLIRGDVVRALSGFREDFFMYCEDVELSLRIRRMGHRMFYQPAARVLHREPVGQRLPPAQAAFLRDRNRRRMVRQHYTPLQRIAFAAWFYPSRVLRIGQYLARGDWAGARAVIAGAVAR